MRGGNESVTPFGVPEAVMVTDPEKPLLRCRFTCVVVLSPGPILRLAGELEMRNSGTRFAFEVVLDFAGDFVAAFPLDLVVFFDEVPLDFLPPVPVSLAGGVAPAGFVVAGPDGSVGPTAPTVETPIPVRATLVSTATSPPVRNRRPRLLALARTGCTDCTDGV
jgi:hypothetical protein